jgi:hypothetical protein
MVRATKDTQGDTKPERSAAESPLADELEVQEQTTLRDVFDRKMKRVRDRVAARREAARAQGATFADDEPKAPLAQQIVVPDTPGEVTITDHHFQGFDLRSVAWFAVRFFACVMGMVLAGALILWLLASVFGLVSAFEEFMDGIGFTDFRLLSIEFLLGLALLTAAFSFLLIGITLVGAGLYNVLASRWGGIRIFVSEIDRGAAITLSELEPNANGDTSTTNGHGVSTTSNGNGNGVGKVRGTPRPYPPLRRPSPQPAGYGRGRPRRRGPSPAP